MLQSIGIPRSSAVFNFTRENSIIKSAEFNSRPELLINYTNQLLRVAEGVNLITQPLSHWAEQYKLIGIISKSVIRRGNPTLTLAYRTPHQWFPYGTTLRDP